MVPFDSLWLCDAIFSDDSHLLWWRVRVCLEASLHYTGHIIKYVYSYTSLKQLKVISPIFVDVVLPLPFILNILRCHIIVSLFAP